MKATEKTLNVLLEEVNLHRAMAGLCPFFFIKKVKNLKLQKRYVYQLFIFPKPGENKTEALKSIQSANSLRLYLAGILDGIQIASIYKKIQNQGVVNEIKTN